MAGRPEPTPLRWYLAEWRDYLRLTQEQVANQIGTNKGQIAKLETGRQRMNDRWIHDLSQTYGIRPGQLLEPPGRATLDDLLTDATPEEITTIRSMVALMLKHRS